MRKNNINLKEVKETPISSKEVYKGVALHLYADDVKLSDGSIVKREVIRDCKACAILAFNEKGEVLVEEQFRYPFQQIITEIPAGKGLDNEDPEVTALREFEEETGYRPNNIQLLGLYAPSIGYSDEVIHIYLATGLIKTKQHLDKDEYLKCYFTSFKNLCKRIANNEITDGKTIAAISYYLIKFKNKNFE